MFVTLSLFLAMARSTPTECDSAVRKSITLVCISFSPQITLKSSRKEGGCVPAGRPRACFPKMPPFGITLAHLPQL